MSVELAMGIYEAAVALFHSLFRPDDAPGTSYPTATPPGRPRADRTDPDVLQIRVPTRPDQAAAA